MAADKRGLGLDLCDAAVASSCAAIVPGHIDEGAVAGGPRGSSAQRLFAFIEQTTSHGRSWKWRSLVAQTKSAAITAGNAVLKSAHPNRCTTPAMAVFTTK
jgi:hypothetical protein